MRLLELQFWEHWNLVDVRGLSESQHSSHLCLSVHSHPLLRCLVMQEGPARGAWSNSKREIYVLHVPFWEWEMSNSQNSARAGERQMSTKEKRHLGSRSRAHHKDLKSQKLGGGTSPPPYPEENIQLPPRHCLKPFGLLGTVSHRSYFRLLP